jgi:putative toxin-antitoxin system antitoxin component (TIGR02293 family)
MLYNNAAPTDDHMFADAMHKDTYRAYRIRLQMLLKIPTDASDQEIHELIEAGFPAGMVKVLCDLGMISTIERDQIIPLKTLKARLARGQRLTLHESDRLFRVAHITAMAMVVFGNDEKSKRWLSKPNDHFSGKSPIAMLSTTQESRRVEEMLIKIAEGFAF